MISTPDRQSAVVLIDDAVTAGAPRDNGCAELEISDRSLRRWMKGRKIHSDQPPSFRVRSRPTSWRRRSVLEVCNSETFANLPHGQMVPGPADQGKYRSPKPVSTASCAQRGSSITAAWPGPGPAQTPHSDKVGAACEVGTWDS